MQQHDSPKNIELVFAYLEPKQGGYEDEELGHLDEDRPVLHIVEHEAGGHLSLTFISLNSHHYDFKETHHAQPGHEEGQPDLEQGRAPTLIRT